MVAASDFPTDDPPTDDPAAHELAADDSAADDPAARELAADDPTPGDRAMRELAARDLAADDPASDDPAADDPAARHLAVVLHDLAWLLPRTVGLEAGRQDPLPQSELEVMRLLVRRPGLSVNDVARELGMQPSNASTAIRLLIARGTLERQADRADGRVTRLYPTPAAYAARDRRERSWGEALASVLDGLGAGDRRRLAEAAPALRLLAARLAGETAPGPAPPARSASLSR
jgi:DNA-binding MarR family transcriptional regulator